MSEIPAAYADKCFFIPENAIDPNRFTYKVVGRGEGDTRICFVGRLVPYKGPDVVLEAAMPLLKDRKLHLDIVGDGPLFVHLRQTIEREGVDGSVTLHGWVEHSKVQDIVRRCHLLAFPSVREFGGGVVLEAMALSVVPIVVDYGGPSELVDSETGYKLPLGPRASIVASLGRILADVVANDVRLDEIGARARARVLELYTWDAKARQVAQVYDWVCGAHHEKPVFGFPSM